jgi:hypothetical protein
MKTIDLDALAHVAGGNRFSEGYYYGSTVAKVDGAGRGWQFTAGVLDGLQQVFQPSSGNTRASANIYKSVMTGHGMPGGTGGL